MKLVYVIAFLAAALPAAGVHAQRQPVPIVNHENVSVVAAKPGAISADAITTAIMSAAQAKKWTVAHVAGSPNKLQASLFVNNKHTVVVEIENTDRAYSIRYVSSIDMKYGVQDGVPVIHPFYNRWVTELMESIRVTLLRT
jgi:hypothetical protein